MNIKFYMFKDSTFSTTKSPFLETWEDQVAVPREGDLIELNKGPGLRRVVKVIWEAPGGYNGTYAHIFCVPVG